MTARSTEGPGAGAAIAGLALAATSLLPLADGAPSLAESIRRAFAEDWLNGVLALLLLGAPHLLGLFLAFAVLARSALSAALLRVPVTILYCQLALLSLMLVRDPADVVSPWSLVGFTAVATLSAMSRASSDRRRSRPPSVAWVGRWGAMLVAGLYGWMLLQFLEDGTPVYAPWATFGAALLLAAACRPRRR